MTKGKVAFVIGQYGSKSQRRTDAVYTYFILNVIKIPLAVQDINEGYV
jgi:hypothetical protein